MAAVRTVFGRHFRIWLLAAALMGATSLALAAPTAASGRQVHVVYAGQRLGSIAKRYNVSIDALCEANGIRRRDPIRPGQRLEIPSRQESSQKSAEPKALAASSAADADSPVTAKQTLRGPDPKTPERKISAELEALSASKSQTSAKTLRSTKTSASTKIAEVKTAITSKPLARKEQVDPTPSAAVAPAPFAATIAGLSHRVQAGESLSAIAVRYDTKVKTLLQVNNLRLDKVIRVGQVLMIPRPATGNGWWTKFARAPRRAGEIEVFAHNSHKHRWSGKLIVNGKVQPAARAALSRLLGATGSAPAIPERLLQLLSHVSDTFGGRPIRLVSGYRTNSYAKDSRHRHSSAVDFSIPGVPNSAVRDYLLQLGSVGVGYYPNSTFVHLDVRARSAYWVDYAGPGEAPRRQPRGDSRLAGTTLKAKRKSTTHTRLRHMARAEVPTAAEVDQLTEQTSADIEVSPLVPLTQPNGAPPSRSTAAAKPVEPSETAQPASSAETTNPRGTATPRGTANPPGPPPAVDTADVSRPAPTLDTKQLSKAPRI